MKNTLRIAIQKKGRLSDQSLQLLKECGIRVNNGSHQLKARSATFPLEVLYLRDDDIPQYVSEGVADVGILGENVVLEKQKEVEITEALGFGKCRLALAIRREEHFTDSSWFENKTIATSYPKILADYLKSNNVNADIEEISGSVEIAPGIGLSDAVCDIVSTGSTLLTNGLKEVETVMTSQAVMIKHNNLPKNKETLLEKLSFRIQSVKNARQNKYILLNAPNAKVNEICSILPGMRSPTILPLAQSGWSSLHSVVQEDDFWNIIDQLKQQGAEGILVCPIEKMVL